MATITTIREAWINVIKTMTVANGYLITIDPANISCNMEDPQQNQTPDATRYPRCLLSLEEEDYEYQPSNRLHKTATWNIGFLVYKPEVALSNDAFPPASQPEDIQSQLEKAIRSFQKLVRDNYRLQGQARLTKIVQSWTDAGYLNPQGLVFFRVEVEYEDSQD